MTPHDDILTTFTPDQCRLLINARRDHVIGLVTTTDTIIANGAKNAAFHRRWERRWFSVFFVNLGVSMGSSILLGRVITAAALVYTGWQFVERRIARHYHQDRQERFTEIRQDLLDELARSPGSEAN